jgi:hypothetical protein
MVQLSLEVQAPIEVLQKLPSSSARLRSRGGIDRVMLAVGPTLQSERRRVEGLTGFRVSSWTAFSERRVAEVSIHLQGLMQDVTGTT